jgi:hypothetical protein
MSLAVEPIGSHFGDRYRGFGVETKTDYSVAAKVDGTARERRRKIPPGTSQPSLIATRLCHNSSLLIVANNVGVNARGKI